MDTRIETFLKHAALVAESRDKVRALCRDELRAIDRDFSTDASRKKRITTYRNALREAHFTKYFLTALKLPKARTKALNAAYDARVVTLASDTHRQPIHDHQALIDRAIHCLASPYYGDIVVGLALLSGRRPVEICVSGDFNADDAPEGCLWFSGQAKRYSGPRKRHDDMDEADDAYCIPLLTDRNEWYDRWLFLRDTWQLHEKYAPLTPQQAASPAFTQTACVFNAAYQRHFAARMPSGSTMRNLRDVYALIAYHTCRHPQDHTQVNLYIRSILGHTDKKGETAMSYQKFYLAEFA